MTDEARTDAPGATADLLVRDALTVVTMDEQRREIAGGWVAVRDGFVVGVGEPGTEPPATRTMSAAGCLVTPGLVNTHHHLYQNLTRAYAPALGGKLFRWLVELYPRWRHIDEEAVHISTWIGLAELALGGCTTTTDHLYVHPHGAGDLMAAEIGAAADLGLRFHPTRGSMSLSEKDGGLPPDDCVEDDDTILAESERVVRTFHDPSPGAMCRIALAPCSPFSVTPELMAQTAELAERLDVRLHTHLAEDPGEDDFCLSQFGRRPVEHLEALGWITDRTWVAHCVHPNPAEIVRLGAAGVGAAHCPSSNMILGAGMAPVRELVAAGAPVGIGCDGSASADAASLWGEARNAMLVARLRAAQAGEEELPGARDTLELATLGGAACLGRTGELGTLAPGAVGDLVAWKLDGVAFAGALSDPVEAWLRCGPVAAHHTVVAGRPIVESGMLRRDDLDEKLRHHEVVARRIQGLGERP